MKLFVSAALLWLTLCTAAAADDTPQVMVQTALQPPGPVVANQQVRLVVTVLTTTWFLHAPEFPEVSAPNAVITLPDEQAINLNQTIDGQQWFGLSRAYLVTPSGGGDVVIPPFEITLWPGQASGAMSVKTGQITLPVKTIPRPAGAANLLTSSGVQISQHLDRRLENLKVGDAFTRTVEVTAADAQGMFIPPTNFAQVDGLAVYPKTGVVDNLIEDRAGFTGSRRIDAATYVVQQAGDYELPAVTIEWWDTRTGTAEKAQVPALQFSAAPNPNFKPEFTLPKEHGGSAGQRINWYYIAGLSAGVFAALSVVYALARLLPRGWHYLQAWQAHRRRRYEASEPAAYKRFAQAARGGDARATYAALLAWVEHSDWPPQLRGFEALCSGHTALKVQVDALRASAYGATSVSWQPQTLMNEVRGQRSLQAALQRHDASLPPLNPA